MGAPTEVYVDPSINANSGAGSIGSPYGDLQYALNTVTRDSTNGNRINIKAGTSEFLTAAISLATYGTPSATAPLIFQGYTSAAGDGGIGVLDGGGSVSIISNSTQFIIAKNLRMTNVGNRVIWQVTGSYSIVEDCYIDGTTGSSGHGLVLADSTSVAANNYVTNCAGNGIQGAHVYGNVLVNSTNKFVVGIVSKSDAYQNLLILDSTSHGIYYDFGCLINGNSIWSNGGTGTGIKGNGSGRSWSTVINNLVEGFSGAGGRGIEVSSGNPMQMMGGNRVYNCTTNYSISDQVYDQFETNTAAGATMFANAGSGDFSPVAAVRAIAWPTAFRTHGQLRYNDLGAVQHQDAGGGTTVIGVIGG